MNSLPSNLVFVDVETTGSNPQSDRVIEIGIIRVESNKIVGKLDTLINPRGAYVSPFISDMTGISPSDVETAPFFDEIKTQVLELLSDAVFVAHSVNFDYSFIKHEFMRLDDTFNSKTLCTVRLARSLFPEMKKFNLDKLISEFNLPVTSRHRAYSDAYCLWDFYQKAYDLHNEELFLKAVNLQLKTSIPEGINKTDVDKLPDGPGVYIFYGGTTMDPALSSRAKTRDPESLELDSRLRGNDTAKDECILYIGKSKNIKSRVLSHFSGQKTSLKSQNIAKHLTRIECINTHGELGALIRESQMIKSLSPVFNRALRRKKEMVMLFKSINKNGYYLANLERVKLEDLDTTQIENIISVFNSKKQANTYLSDLIKQNNLCSKLLDLEKANGACLNYELGQCDGACINKENVLKYNLRFLESFSKSLVPKWPFEGKIGIEETGYYGKEVHLVDKWCYLGSIVYDKEGNINESYTPQHFDWSIYKLIKKYVNSQSSRVNIVNIK